MKIPEPILQYLKSNRIITPTPIQLQGIPAAYVSLTSFLQPLTYPIASQDVT
jgi:superfamily II DNA/RNA helicase